MNLNKAKIRKPKERNQKKETNNKKKRIKILKISNKAMRIKHNN